jgi:GNAT superfamily N-acetyltransferase
MATRILPLAETPAHVDTLAAWHHAEWQHLFSGWTLDSVRAELLAHAQQATCPGTWALLCDDELAGSVSVIAEDAPEFSDRGSPWLASLYVLPRFRGRGFGVLLTQAAERAAGAAGYSRLHLFTPQHEAFYQRLGWRTDERAQLHGEAVALMSKELIA